MHLVKKVIWYKGNNMVLKNNIHNKFNIGSFEVPKTELKKTVRVNFKLSEEAYESLTWLTKYLNSTSKEVFELIFKISKLTDTVIDAIIKLKIELSKNSIRKTYAISRGTKKTIKTVSEKHKISRDLLVDRTIIAAKFSLESENEKALKNVEQVSTVFSQLRPHLYEAEEKLDNLLDADNLINEEFGVMMVHFENYVMEELKKELEFRKSLLKEKKRKE